MRGDGSWFGGPDVCRMASQGEASDGSRWLRRRRRWAGLGPGASQGTEKPGTSVRLRKAPRRMTGGETVNQVMSESVRGRL